MPFWTLAKKETIRFFSVPLQTILAPIVSAVLFLFVFGVNLGQRINVPGELTYAQFVIPGLILMSAINNSFANSSSSLFFSRYIGNIVDLLVTPIGPLDLSLAYTLPSIFRGLIVAIAVWIVSAFFTPLPWTHPILAVLMIFLVTFLFAQFGILAGLYSESFETLSIYNNFVLLPLIYLGGLFYPIHILPEFWAHLSKFNPLFYMIDGFRQTILGVGETSLALDFAVVGGISVIFLVWTYTMLRLGYKIRT